MYMFNFIYVIFYKTLSVQTNIKIDKMKKLMMLGLLSFLSIGLFAQPKINATRIGAAEKSDPQAVSILSQVNKKYASYQSMQLDLKLTIEDGKFKEVQEGKVSVKGNKFRVKSKEQEIVSDGKTNWIYLIQQNELQISNPDPDDVAMFSSPDKLLKSFEKEYISQYAGTATEEGKVVHVIEFKPADRNSEYTKVRVTIDKVSLNVQKVKVFDRSNIHYTIEVLKFVKNPTISDTYFTFDEKKVPKENIVRLN
jgi:outer membrane lipoprotein carrier protein